MVVGHAYVKDTRLGQAQGNDRTERRPRGGYFWVLKQIRTIGETILDKNSVLWMNKGRA